VTAEGRWTADQAAAWYDGQPWLVGCNFIPSTACNQLEMWQAETFDLATIERELDWAARLGFNTVRVFLHDLLWEADARGFRRRIDAFLDAAAARAIRPLFVLFEDCWNDGAALGPQQDPVPGVHNSRWLQSPGHRVVGDETQLPRLEAYVKGVVGAFSSDARVLGWDIYNEVTNGFLSLTGVPRERRAEVVAAAERRRAAAMPAHLRLLELSFAWARSSSPSQPLTAGAYTGEREINERLFALSDIISFHSYDPPERLASLIERLRRHGRPIICTEYMARTRGSDFRTALPIFKRERVGCYNWGLVNGRTQTHIAWTGEDHVWFHDVFHPDGTPYDADEVAFIREMTGVSAPA